MHYRGRLQCFSAILVLFGSTEAGFFSEVADKRYAAAIDQTMGTSAPGGMQSVRNRRAAIGRAVSEHIQTCVTVAP